MKSVVFNFVFHICDLVVLSVSAGSRNPWLWPTGSL